MKVEIVNATYLDPVAAASFLIFTKHTRLEMNPGGAAEMYRRCRDEPDWMYSELEYISKTIKSSWEFLDVTFSIQGISRACAQQLTRTRFTPIDGDIFGSYAMQSQRVTDVRNMGYYVPNDPAGTFEYEKAIAASMQDYEALVADGMKLENARGVLPMNSACNIVAKYNFRMLTELVKARTSGRAQSEFQELAMKMHDEIIKIWPWAEMFFKPGNEKAVGLLAEINNLLEELGEEVDPWKDQLKTLVSKVRDQLI